MRISYDPAKNERNIRDRGLSFDAVVDFASRMPGGIVRADAEPRLVSIRP